jgi:glycosyltransferase involved in cell wall biosynthesis
MARILQVSGWYPPYRLGGTEVYLEGLISALRPMGVASAVLVPRVGSMPERYAHLGTSVETYRVNEKVEATEFRWGVPHQEFELFRQKLKGHREAIYHQHSWTRGCGPHHLQAARDLGMRTVVTVHVPSNICLRGTMLRFGKVACDGQVSDQICGACCAQGKGMPTAVARTIAMLPLAAAKIVRRRETRLATALSARALGAEKLEQLREMFANSDRIVAVCGWLHEALLANGIPANKLVLSRQGVSDSFFEAVRTAPRSLPVPGSPLRLLYLGRLDPVKGLDVVVRAIRSLPADFMVSLTVFAHHGGTPVEQAYEAGVRALAGSDARIEFKAPVDRDEVASVMLRHDAIVVPSVWLETGPLVVLEAMAAGLFVLGSRRGGVAELVGESDAGDLVEATDVDAWARAIARLAGRHSQAKQPVQSRRVRTMATVAAEMADLYRSL